MRTFLEVTSCFCFLIWLTSLLSASVSSASYLVASLVAAGFAAVLARIDEIYPRPQKPRKFIAPKG